MTHGEIIQRAYAFWIAGNKNGWASLSPYICDNVRYATGYTDDDVQLAKDICELITSIVGESVQTHLGISQEDYKGDEVMRSRDPRAMAFRLGMWHSLAERYGVQL